MELFKILGTIAINNSEANKALKDTSATAKNTAEDVESTSSAAEKSSGRWGNAFKKIGSGALAVGKTIATGLAAGATALGALTVKALASAGELEQNMGGSEAVFGEYAGKMQETAKKAFSQMGLSTSDYLATANKMGALFQGAGFSVEESMNLSSGAMQRAADVASIMGIDTASAMEAVAGAAKGNFTMMDNLGVAMNETTLANYALEKGMKKSYDQMTQQEKIGLAMEMFMDKTAYAAGNYANENETLAGSLGTAKAALSNFISGSGSVEDVVSSFSNFANVVVKNIDEMFPKLMTGITQLVEQLVPMIPPLLEKLLPSLISGATSLINGLVSAAPQVVQALLAAVPALISGISQITNVLISALPSMIQMICAALPDLIPALVSGLVQMIVTLCTMLPQIIQPIIDNIPMIIVSLVTAILSNLPILLSGIGKLIVGIISAIPKLLSALWQSITTLASNFAKTLFGKIEGWIRQLFPKSADTIFKILTTIKNAFSTFVKNIGAVLSVVVSVISTPFKLAWNGVKLVWDNCVAFFRLIWSNIKSIFSVVDSVLSGDFRGAWNGIKSIWSNTVQFFKDIISNVKNAFSNVGEILTAPFRKGRDAIKKIIDNIKGFFTGLKLTFPKIKLPHFSITPSGWKIGDLLKGVKPKLGIDWYASAMNNPMVMTKPTIFGYNPTTGQLQGGGEAGSEMVGGTNTVMNMIRAAVASQNEALVYYMQKIIEILATYFPQLVEAFGFDIRLDSGALVGELVVPMNNALGKLSARKDRGR